MASSLNDDLGLDFLLNGSASTGQSGQVTNSVDKIIAALDAVDAPQQQQSHAAPAPQTNERVLNFSNADEDDDEEDDDDYDDEHDMGSGSIDIAPAPQQQRPRSPPRLDPVKELEMKRETLFQLNRMRAKGVPVTQFTLASDLTEMQAELDRLKREAEIDKSLRFQRHITMAAVTGLEKVSGFVPLVRKYANLDGWSNSVNEQIGDFDEIFEELHQKYRGKSKMAPELRLLMSLVGSAVLTHVTNSFISKHIPGLDQVIKQNPGVMKELGSAVMGTMSNNATDAAKSGGGEEGFMSGLMGFMSSMAASDGKGGKQQGGARPGVMKGPRNFDAMMRELNTNGESSRLETFSNTSETDISELRDETTSMSGYSLSSKGRRRVLHL